jgi:hypothetical protein
MQKFLLQKYRDFGNVGLFIQKKLQHYVYSENFAALSMQMINQNSFQLLQEYLNAAKGAGSFRQHPYNFVFFIRDKTDAGNLKKVEITLPPPQARYSDNNSMAELLPTTRKSISRLLVACGLSDYGGLPAEEDDIRLSEFFQQASEIQRHNDASATDFERRLAGMKNALRLGRGIKVSFRPPLSELPGKEQVESLEKLAIALDASQDVKLQGHTLLIGNCYGIDALGNLWINYEDNVESWSDFLKNVDLCKAAKNQRDASERRVLELKAARLMEVEMVFTHDSLAIQPDYTHFLHRTIKDAFSYGAVGQGKFHQLPLRITNPTKELHSDEDNIAADETSYMQVNDTLGYISVPVWENIPNIYKYIERNGDAALQTRDRLKHSEEHVEQVKLLVRRKLRLRHLSFDKKLRNEMCIAACIRLIHFAPDLEKYMEGLSVCISDEHQLPIEGIKSSLHLKWNFSLAEL